MPGPHPTAGAPRPPATSSPRARDRGTGNTMSALAATSPLCPLFPPGFPLSLSVMSTVTKRSPGKGFVRQSLSSSLTVL